MYDCICICPRIFKTISAPGSFLMVYPARTRRPFIIAGNDVPRPVPSGRSFQLSPGIDSQPGIPLRIFFELLFAPVAAEIIFLVLVRGREFCILFINYHQTDGIGCHGVYLIPVLGSWLFP